MKTKYLLLAGAFFLAAVTAAHAASLSLSLPAITNDYVGKVSLNITGLPTAGKTVLIERFTDINGNGVIDVNQDALFVSFTVTDGQLPVIGGVRNLAVPGDDDAAANSAIRVDLPFPGTDKDFGGASGKFVYRVSDPQSAFSPVTAAFEVKKAVLSQGVAGQVTAAAGGAPVAGAFVAIGTADGDGVVSATIADASGNYSLFTPPGNYVMYMIRTNFVVNFSTTMVTVSAGQVATKNVALAAGGFAVTGKLSDQSSSAGIAGIFIAAESTDNQFAGAVTDANGNYSFALTAAQWKIRPQEKQLSAKGYLKLQNAVFTNTTASGSAVINISLPKATALIYGTVKDNLNNAVNGLGILAQDQGNIYEGETVTFAPNGDYTLGVLPGTWSVGPDADSLIARGYTGGAGIDLTLTLGQAIQANFIVQGVTAHLRGQIRDGSGTPISNIRIVVQPFPIQSSGGAASIYPTTDGNGNFDAGVGAGTWNIALDCVEAENRGYVNLSGFNYTVVDGVDQNGLVLNFPAFTAIISGTVKDSLNQPIIGVTLDASQSIDQNHHYYPGCISTDNNGNYSIKVLSGTWNVAVRNNELNARGYGSVLDQNVAISGGVATANFVATPLPSSLSAPVVAGNNRFNFTVTVPQLTGYGYSVQYSTNMKAQSWITLLNTNPAGNSFQFSDVNASNGFRFYRVTSP